MDADQAPGTQSAEDEPHHVIHQGLATYSGIDEPVRWAVAHAVLAPSEHNSQPWIFKVHTSADGTVAEVRLRLDRARTLDRIDPTHREAVLACGAALVNLRLALTGAELDMQVRLCPDPADRDLLASILVQGHAVEDPSSADLRMAIARRSTFRGAFEPTTVPPEVQITLQEEASEEGGLVSGVADEAREAIEDLVTQAQRTLWEDSSFREEASRWARANSSSRRDGVPGYAFGQGAVHSWLQPTLERHLGRAPWSAQRQVEAVRDAPALFVVGSEHDTRIRVLQAGASMQRLLLRARAAGLSASYLNAPLHVPPLRHQLGLLLDVPCPQVLIRMGYGPPSPLTPRRGLGEVLTTAVDEALGAHRARRSGSS